MAARMFTLRCKSANISERTHVIYAEKLRALRLWLSQNGDYPPGTMREKCYNVFIRPLAVSYPTQ